MMSRHLVVACLVYLALIIQPSLGGGFDHALFRPWLPGIAIVFCVALTNGASGLVWSGLLGLGIDCLSGNRIGVHLISATTAASLLVLLQAQDGPRSVVFFGGAAFAATFVARGLSAVAQLSLDRRHFELRQFCIAPMCEAIASAGLLLAILLACRLLTRSGKTRANAAVTLSNRWSMLTGE